MTKLNADYNKIFNYFLLGYILLISVAAYSTKNNILLILNSFAGMSFWFLLCFGVLTVLKKRHKDNKRHLSEKPIFFFNNQCKSCFIFFVVLLGQTTRNLFSFFNCFARKLN